MEKMKCWSWKDSLLILGICVLIAILFLGLDYSQTNNLLTSDETGGLVLLGGMSIWAFGVFVSCKIK